MTAQRDTPHRGEDGFGVIEIVVAMFLIGLLAIFVLPLVMLAMQTSAKSASIGTATDIVNAELTEIRAAATSCSTLAPFRTSAPAAVTDDRGVGYQAVRTIGACPATYPGSVTITVSVLSEGDTISTATTRVLLARA
ncbi:hypothetical protein MN032_08815 [Agromyces atrinae]|uniref:type IV pilus modification PilV family protein n=1 Tax=Agromyces atrinae TaxID=592376 RepID=UPI001F573805|nr:hypothetical protein [Agromyces atrinae]MCI2957791.1 hypothetical protein [Agromyces atrinae]